MSLAPKSHFIATVTLSLHFIFAAAAAPPADPLAQAVADWVETTTEGLNAASTVINLPKFGPIEYVKNGAGPVILSMHGGPGGYDQSALIAEHLIASGFSVLGVSRPGYLRTPLIPGTNDTAAFQAEEMVALLDALGIPKVAVLGFSAGGPVAFQMALNSPGRVSALIMEGIGAQPGDSDFYSFVQGLLADPESLDPASFGVYTALYNDEDATRASVLSMDTSLTNAPLQARIDFVTANQKPFYFRFVNSLLPLRLRRAGLTNDIAGVNVWDDYKASNYFGKVSVPTMIIQSRNDTSGNFAQTVEIAAQIPGSQLVPLESTGHFCWLGANTAAWQTQLSAFLHEAIETQILLEVQPGRNEFRISWKPASGRLQVSTNAAGPWTNTGLANSAMIPFFLNENRFYRISNPQ